MTKIWMTKDGQTFLTIPKKIVEAIGWSKGTEVAWKIESKKKLSVSTIK